MSRLSRPNMGMAEARPFAGMSQVHAHATGADVGAHEIMVCVPGGEGMQLVRSFGSYTVDLQAIGKWLAEHGVQTVAMESTGVYWIPLFEELERRGFHCHLTLAPYASAGVSSRSFRRVPGRKSDVVDCQWIQTLHSYGLLESSFRPEADLVALRTLLRHRAQLIQHRAPHILHMQKALLQMNIQLSQALRDVSGETGQTMIRAIVAGERDPHQLATLRNYRCKKDEQEIAKALTGTWRVEHLFILKQSLEFYDFYTKQLEACDSEIERTYSAVRPNWIHSDLPELPQKRNSYSKNAPKNVQVRKHLKRICGVDLTAVHGVSASLAQTIALEVGTDMQKFPTEKHFCSWLGLAPKKEISGGKVLKNNTLKIHNRAGQAFRMAARSVMRADCVFGAFYRRQKTRLGPAQAAVATAHLMARVVYKMLKYKVEYEPLSVSRSEQHYREQQLKYLHKKAAKFGFQLTPI
ncbi:MAG TPA: IS110 family transposase [Anaerolineales bacterium]|nr:IS110 family transposase [Anaerolineales bacterium]